MEHPDILHVTLFGGFQLSRQVAGQTCTINDQVSTSKKLWAFLQYLIVFRHREISQEEIIDILWDSEDDSNAVNALKTLLHRARTTLETLGYGDGKQVILYRRGVYAWNRDLPLDVDSERFESLCDQADQNSQSRLPLLLAALELYRGPFLPKSSYEPWVISQRTYYHNRFLALCSEVSSILSQQGRSSEIIDLCRRSLVFAPYEEPLHLSLMQALVATGAQQAAIEHYRYITKLFMDELGVTPSESLTDLYRDLVKSTRSVELDLTVVRQSLSEDTPDPGPYFCEYAIFQDIYRLEARTAQRTGHVVQLAMLSILSARGKDLTTKQIRVSMERLKEIVIDTLRKGDACTRFSASQYLMLLPCATREGGEVVLSRLVASFRRLYPKMPVLIQYSILPVMPLMPLSSPTGGWTGLLRPTTDEKTGLPT